MIIYGTRAVQTAKEVVTDKCTNCGAVASIDMHVFQKYAHVFWIPFFPVSKTGVSQCDKCKQVLKPEQMPAALRDSYGELKTRSKTPVWMFAGLALVAVLIVAAFVFESNKTEKNAKLIQSPQKGDIFEIRTKDYQYTLYKVDYVQKDSVFVFINNYETNKSSGLTDILLKGDKAFSEDVYGYTRAELKEMLASGEIIDIKR